MSSRRPARAGPALRLALGAAWLAAALPGATPAAAAADGAQRLLHSERSLYRDVLVYQDQDIRCLCFTRLCAIGRQSCVDLQTARIAWCSSTRR